MPDAENLSTLIGDIYDAALDPSLWPRVLGSTARFIGGPCASLLAKDIESGNAELFFDDGGLDPRFKQLYFEKYSKLDPTNVIHYFAEIGKPISTIDLMPLEDFRQSRVYKEWIAPQQLVDFISVALEKTATSVAMFGVFRHKRDGLADEASLQRTRLLAPHIRRAVLIGRAIDLKTIEADTFAQTLDGLAAGMFLVDAGGRIVHQNAAAQRLLHDSDVLRTSGGRLSAGDPETDRGLRDIFASAEKGDAMLGTKGISVPLRSRDDVPYVAHVLPLTSGVRRRTGLNTAAVAAVFIHKAELATPTMPEVIAKSYKLTPTELRVLLAVVESGGAPEVAEILGIAETTVKFHLRRLFEKTGAKRQADLVKLLAGFANPLATVPSAA